MEAYSIFHSMGRLEFVLLSIFRTTIELLWWYRHRNNECNMGATNVVVFQQKESRQMSKKENVVILEVVKWWKSKAPYSMTHDEHMNNPCVNCKSPEDESLATSIADYLYKASNANQLIAKATHPE